MLQRNWSLQEINGIKLTYRIYIFSLLLEHSFCSDKAYEQYWESIKTHHGNVLRISVLGSFLFSCTWLQIWNTSVKCVVMCCVVAALLSKALSSRVMLVVVVVVVVVLLYHTLSCFCLLFNFFVH